MTTRYITTVDPRDPYDVQLARSADWPAQSLTLPARFAGYIASEPSFYGLLGLGIFFAVWYLVTGVLTLPRFNLIPNPIYLFQQWVSADPEFGVSLFTPEYYQDILISTLRVYEAFAIAVMLGTPLGILIGWSELARNLLYPIIEMLRPIPPLAWVPLAVLLLYGNELPVIFVTLLAAFFVTVLNTYLGVRSINRSYFRAASCLGYNRWQVLIRVVIPGALPFIFTGLQLAMGVAWFALVGGELIAGRSGLGFLIFDGYTQVALPNIFIGMITLGVLGYASSAIIRKIGNRLMAWQIGSRV
jgi:NitT/TauT family transport system permease protein